LTEYNLFEIFSDLSGGRVERVKKCTKNGVDFAFAHFKSREGAEMALNAASNFYIEVSVPPIFSES
jgi:hypothetical protein